MKIKRLFIIFLSSLLLSGCYDYIEPNDLCYVVAIGIDEGEEGLYKYTLQFARPSQISGGSSEEGGKGDETIGSVSVVSPSVYSAVNAANHIISKTFTLSHTKIIVISDTVARSGIGDIVDFVGRSSDLRPTVFLCVSRGNAGEYLASVKPVVEINPVKYYRLIFENPNSSYIPKNDAGSVFSDLKSKTREISLPLVGVGKGSKEENGDNKTQEPQSSLKNEKTTPNNKSGFEYHINKYVAGNLDVEKQNESEVVGAAVFKDDKMVGILDGIECEMLNMLSGKYTNSYTSLYVPQSPNHPVTLRIEQTKKPKNQISFDNGKIKITQYLFLEGVFMSVPGDYLIENNLEEFEIDASKYIEEFALEFLNKTSKKYQSDIVGFAKSAKKKFLSNDDFYAFSWNDKYRNAEFECIVNFGINRPGLTKRNFDE